MSPVDYLLLEQAGWTIECEAPLELRHPETGSFASSLAAIIVLADVRTCATEALPVDDMAAEDKLVAAMQQVLTWTTVAAQQNTEDSWKLVFGLVFSKNGSQKISGLRLELGVAFDYCDPDASYQEDVLAYATALRELATRLTPYYPVFATVR